MSVGQPFFDTRARWRKLCESIILRRDGCKHLPVIVVDRKSLMTLRRLLVDFELHLEAELDDPSEPARCFMLLLSCNTLAMDNIQAEASREGRTMRLLVELINKGWPDASKWYRKP